MAGSGERGFEVHEDQGVTIVRLKMAQIDMFNVTELIEDLGELTARQTPAIVLDMGETNFIDSSGMGGLIRIHQQVKAYDGIFLITGLNPKVANLMRLTRSTRYLNCYDDLDTALAAARR
ncbi:MAG: STAS domain-containing protein [Spirochaetales bacterium]|nr:STAS domain-containing protein [Leptospiraceae bacterium]MCP5483104.1 STAS domain-containing protein [Spirochaetales bacterium]MCP5484544.1 STAS domain-containing protein [Spirochaetales bacterium]